MLEADIYIYIYTPATLAIALTHRAIPITNAGKMPPTRHFFYLIPWKIFPGDWKFNSVRGHRDTRFWIDLSITFRKMKMVQYEILICIFHLHCGNCITQQTIAKRDRDTYKHSVYLVPFNSASMSTKLFAKAFFVIFYSIAKTFSWQLMIS